MRHVEPLGGPKVLQSTAIWRSIHSRRDHHSEHWSFRRPPRPDELGAPVARRLVGQRHLLNSGPRSCEPAVLYAGIAYVLLNAG